MKRTLISLSVIALAVIGFAQVEEAVKSKAVTRVQGVNRTVPAVTHVVLTEAGDKPDFTVICHTPGWSGSLTPMANMTLEQLTHQWVTNRANAWVIFPVKE